MVRNVSNIGVVAALAVVIGLCAAGPAQADLITGGLSLSSASCGNGCNSVLPVAGAVQVALGSATGLDFTTTGLLTPGTAGLFHVDNSTGNFSVLYNLSGSIMDFSFAGSGTASYPAVPITGFQLITAPAFSFDLQSLMINQQTDDLLTLSGTGVFNMVGFDPTPGTFFFSANQAGGTLSYSASEAAVPEPGSLTLLGIGLFGLAGAVRKRLAARK
jgi:hypothetical protein